MSKPLSGSEPERSESSKRPESSASEVLRCAGLPPGLFAQQRVLVDNRRDVRPVAGESVRVSRDPAIGLKPRHREQPEQYDPIGLAALAAASFGEAVRQTGRYKELTCPEEILTETSDGEVEQFNSTGCWPRRRSRTSSWMSVLRGCYRLRVTARESA